MIVHDDMVCATFIRLAALSIFFLKTFEEEIPPGHGEALGSHRPSEGHVPILTELPSAQEFWDKYVSIKRPVVFRAPGRLINEFYFLAFKFRHQSCRIPSPIGLWEQAHSHGAANATPSQQDASFLPHLGIFYYCYIFVVKEKSPEILVELNLGLCDIVESSNLFLHTHYPFDCNDI